MNPEIEQAFRDWLSGSAYIDNNGNYRIRWQTEGGYYRSARGPIAPWNKAVKRAFVDCDAFHAAAHRWEQTQ